MTAGVKSDLMTARGRGPAGASLLAKIKHVQGIADAAADVALNPIGVHLQFEGVAGGVLRTSFPSPMTKSLNTETAGFFPRACA